MITIATYRDERDGNRCLRFSSFGGNFIHANIERKRKKLEKQPWIFYRYIGDIFGVFQGTQAELQDYFKELNSFHPDLKFTIEYDKMKLPFLDTLVYI